MGKRRSSQSQEFCRRVQTAFGERLQSVRLGSIPRISQAELADALGVSRTSVSNIENGRHRVFLDQIYAAAHALRVPVTTLLPEDSSLWSVTAVHVSANAEIDAHQLEQLAPMAAAAVRKASARYRQKQARLTTR